MKAWQAARNESRITASSQSGKSITGNDPLVSYLKQRAKSYKFKSKVCFFCQAKQGAMTTGVLPVVGPIYKCKKKACTNNYKKTREQY